MAEKKINGRTFKVEPLRATEAIKLYALLLASAGTAVDRLPQLIVALSSEGEAEANIMADVAAIATVSQIARNAGPDGVTETLKMICETAMVLRPSGAYDQVDFDGDMTAHLKDIFPLAKFVLKEQYSDFFPVSGAGGIFRGLINFLRT
jgi:hypothetical protein